MNETHIVVVDLDQLCAAMAQALPDLECPECCGPIYECIESGSKIYLEEMYWAYFFSCIHQTRQKRQKQISHPPDNPAS